MVKPFRRRRREPATVLGRVAHGEGRERGQGERHPDEAHRQALEVARLVDDGDAAHRDGRRQVREEDEHQRLERAAGGLGQRAGGRTRGSRPSAGAAVATAGTSCGEMPMSRMPRCIDAPRTAPTAGAKMPIRSTRHRPDDDAEVVEQRRRPVEEEPPLGDEHLAERHRAGEQHLREAHDPEQLDVEARGSGSKPGTTRSAVSGATMNRTTDTMPMTRTASVRIVRPKSWAAVLALLALEPGEDRDEVGRQAARDDDAEQQLRDEERGLEGIELVTDAERLAERPLSDQARK